MTETSNPALPLSPSGRPAMDVIVDAARAAGEVARTGWNTEKEITFKGRADIVTDIDLAAEKRVLEILTGEFPDFGILAEESQPVDGTSPYRWVVDPIDGTRNYAHGIPHFCTIVALAEGSDIVAGVIYDPVRDEMFSAAKGPRRVLERRTDRGIEVRGTVPLLAEFRPRLRGRKGRAGLGHDSLPVAPYV